MLARGGAREMPRRPKPLMHAKTTRRQNRFFGDLSPQEIARHGRKLADLRRADAVNDISLEATARRLATVFPQEIDAEPHLTVVRAFLHRPANTIHTLRGRSTRQRRHQVALRLLRAITIEGETREDYCKRTGLDTGDASRMLDHLCSKDQELRCAVELISDGGTSTSPQNRQPYVATCYDINVRNGVGLDALRPAVRLAIKTTQGLKVLEFPNAKLLERTDSTGTSAYFRQPGGEVDVSYEYAARFEAQAGDVSITMFCRDEPPKDWLGIESVYEPGNETVTVGVGDDDYVGVHGVTRDGKSIEEIADTGDPGLQRPGDRWVRVGPRVVVEARKGSDKLQANTTTPPTFRANPCACTKCAGAPELTWRVARVDEWLSAQYHQQYRLVDTPQLPGRGYDCKSLQVRRDVRWRQRGQHQLVRPAPQRRAPRISMADPRNILRPWNRASRKQWSTPTLVEVPGLWATPSLVEIGPVPQSEWPISEVFHGATVNKIGFAP